MCWQCVLDEKLSQETFMKIKYFLEKYPNAEFGPAHIVLSDLNVGNESIKWVLGLTKAALTGNPSDLYEEDERNSNVDVERYPDHSREELWGTVKILFELLEIPEEDR